MLTRYVGAKAGGFRKAPVLRATSTSRQKREKTKTARCTPCSKFFVSRRFPAEVWSYLNSAPPGQPAKGTRREQLIAKWRGEGKVKREGYESGPVTIGNTCAKYALATFTNIFRGSQPVGSAPVYVLNHLLPFKTDTKFPIPKTFDSTFSSNALIVFCEPT